MIHTIRFPSLGSRNRETVTSVTPDWLNQDVAGTLVLEHDGGRE